MIALGLGSSDPNALGWLKRAIASIKALPSFRIDTISPIYESDALLPPGAPPEWNIPYLNLVVAGNLTSPYTTPFELLAELKALEKKLGRRERARWAPREIDIDILAMTDVSLASETLSIPHIGLLERPFALLPLQDAAPQLLEHLGCPATARARELIQCWRAPGNEVPFRTRKTFLRLTELVAIFNLTPDSFSDGGKLLDDEAILRAAQTAIDAGARILDLGAESTRPGAALVTPAQEWDRLLPALRVLGPLRARTPGLQLSLDSRHAETMERALNFSAGMVGAVSAPSGGGCIDWLNDVTSFDSPRARAIAREADCEIVVMHSLGIPPRRDVTLSESRDAVEELVAWGHGKLDELERAGIPASRVILDPGIGFGKTPAQNLEVLRRARELHVWRARLLVGHSRKSFLAALTSVPAQERDFETAILSAELADQGIEYLRIHEPASQSRALRLSAAWDGRVRYFEADNGGECRNANARPAPKSRAFEPS